MARIVCPMLQVASRCQIKVAGVKDLEKSRTSLGKRFPDVRGSSRYGSASGGPVVGGRTLAEFSKPTGSLAFDAARGDPSSPKVDPARKDRYRWTTSGSIALGS